MFNVLRFSFGKIKPFKVSGQIQGNGIRFKSSVTPMNILIQSPLEAVISSLAACEVATLKALTSKTNLKIGNIKIKNIESGLDLEKFKKGGPQNKLQDIKIDVQIQTNVTQQELNKWLVHAQNSCPVYQMLKSAGVKIQSNWKNVQALP